MIDFTYFEGRDGDIVVKELAVVDSNSNIVSTYVFRRPYRMIQTIDQGCNLNYDGVLYSEGTAVAQWLRCCDTNRKVAGSIPAGVNGIFIDTKPFRSHYGPGVDSASNRNEYQEHFLR